MSWLKLQHTYKCWELHVQCFVFNTQLIVVPLLNCFPFISLQEDPLINHIAAKIVENVATTKGQVSQVTVNLFEPRYEKTCLWGLWPVKTQTSLLSWWDLLGSWNFGYSKLSYYTIKAANNKGADQIFVKTYFSVPVLRYLLQHGFGYNTARSWLPNVHFPIDSL